MGCRREGARCGRAGTRAARVIAGAVRAAQRAWLGAAIAAIGLAAPSDATVLVDLHTNRGTITFELFDATQPITVQNFLGYAQSGRYDASIFHRFVPGFVLQGGGYRNGVIGTVYGAADPMLGPLGDPETGPFQDLALTAQPIPTDPAIQNEPGRSNVRGTIAMAKRASSPHSATSQFFINLADNSGPPASLDTQNQGFTVFGEVVAGMTIADGQLVDAQGGAQTLSATNLAGDQIHLVLTQLFGQLVAFPDHWRDHPSTTAFGEIATVQPGPATESLLRIDTLQVLGGPPPRAHELRLGSSDAATSIGVGGTLAQQLATLNAAPPAWDGGTWVPVLRRATHVVGQPRVDCSAPGFDPGAVPFVSAQTHLARDEVSHDACGSAFYRFTFDLPAAFVRPSLFALASVDDQAVAWLNGVRVSGRMSEPGCTPPPGASDTDPCLQQHDTGKDRVDAGGLAILTAPSRDAFATTSAAAFRAGTNELVIGVAGDVGPADPSGLELRAWVGWDDGPDADGDHVADAVDNCPTAPNADQLDRGGVGTSAPPDGIGDACQCGDVSGDGKVTNADAVLISRALLVPPTATMPRPERCHVGGSPGCTTADVVILRRALLVPPTATLGTACQ